MSKNKYIAIIPARGGSKGLPKKNILDLAGTPLIAHTIQAALASECFSKVVVTTDCSEIKKVSLNYLAEVIDRPSELATDTASSLDVISHALEQLKDDGCLVSHFVLLQPTSPLRSKRHIREAIDEYQGNDNNTLVSVSSCEENPFKTVYIDRNGDMQPMRRWDDLTSARQLLPKAFKPNGAVYIASSEQFLLDQLLINESTGFYVMGKAESIDIDDKQDLLIAEKLLVHE